MEKPILITRRAATVLLAAGALGAADQFAPANPEWNRHIEPFHVVGNIYYVGVADVSSYLITTPEGHFLLDAGFHETAPIVQANIQKLGCRVADVRLLLISHGHYDHVGGMAEIRARTKAVLLANPIEARLLSRGGKDDFSFGDAYPYPPAVPDRLLQNGEEVRLGGTVLTPLFTPGHTKGCTSWTTTVKEGGKAFQVVIPCSVSTPDYRLVDNPKYPEIQKDFATTFATLRALPCDIFLGLHSWDFGLHQKIKARASNPGGKPFVDPEGFRRFLDRGELAIRELVAKQQAH
jgi:metallo-beta-lactamase class B